MQLFLDNVLILGAGKIGSTIADMLAELHGVSVTLADLQPAPAQHDDALVHYLQLDVQDDAALATVLQQHALVINALPFFCAQRVATAAAQYGVHYFDLTEDVAATRTVQALAPQARSVLMPQCGLAPGVIGMLGGHLATQFDELYDLQLRVGALTRHASNALRYHFTWSIDGVINEYCNPCDAVVNGQAAAVQPLEGMETFSLDGELFEAFNTSGGLGTLCDTLAGRVRNLNYKTMRHPGHRDAMHLLLHGLRLIERRDLLRQVLEGAVPHSRDDMVVMAAMATGIRAGKQEQLTRSARIYGAPLRGKQRTAIELTTAAGVLGAVELFASGQLPQRGFVRQEQCPLPALLATRVGHYFAGLQDPAPGADAGDADTGLLQPHGGEAATTAAAARPLRH
ncbi:saccharopine dehydrogenase family protein [Comamonas sp. GB3 AK4-5]|uniref:saccharopine dehydrogenase family protein n=1 Tax=Comamonas sp. GB3 AK4-5 TaxID=3231487 RepID=UPI00351E4A67